MVDKKNKGGKSVVLRCETAYRRESDCPFYCQLRRSMKLNLWYVAPGYVLNHNCSIAGLPSKHHLIEQMLRVRLYSESSSIEISEKRRKHAKASIS